MNEKNNPGRRPFFALFSALLLVATVGGLSQISTTLWGGGYEESGKQKVPVRLVVEEEMTVARFGEANEIPRPVLKQVLGLRSRADLQKRLDSFGLSRQEIARKVELAMTLQAEDSSKNWLKIPLKFCLWFVTLLTAFLLLRKRKITPGVRKGLYLAAVVLFGVIFGADPSPMGPVKDAIALYGAKGVVFKPRMVALAIFLGTVLLVNKSICAWGCQFGTLQDLLFRLNRDRKDTRGLLRQYKPPFMVTNTIRILFFCLFTTGAVAWATDIIEPIDPFKFYKPAVVTGAGWGFLGVLLPGSLVVYRPWCHLFCPFGLAGWLVEQFSIVRIRVRQQTCTGCGACAKACPSTVMGAILDDRHVRPDCFACGTCITVCPTESIFFTAKNMTGQNHQLSKITPFLVTPWRDNQ